MTACLSFHCHYVLQQFSPACTEIEILRPASLGFSFSYLFAAVIDLLLGLLPVQKIQRKCHQDG